MLKQELQQQQRRHQDPLTPPPPPPPLQQQQQQQPQKQPTAVVAAAATAATAACAGATADADFLGCRGIVRRGKRKGRKCGNELFKNRVVGFCRHHDGLRQRKKRATGGGTGGGAAAGGGGKDTDNNMAGNESDQGMGGGGGVDAEEQQSSVGAVAKLGKLKAKSKENGFKSWDVKEESGAGQPKPKASDGFDMYTDSDMFTTLSRGGEHQALHPTQLHASIDVLTSSPTVLSFFRSFFKMFSYMHEPST